MESVKNSASQIFLTLSVLVKGIQDQAPQEVQNILSWAQDNLMTTNLTKTKEMVI